MNIQNNINSYLIDSFFICITSLKFADIWHKLTSNISVIYWYNVVHCYKYIEINSVLLCQDIKIKIFLQCKICGNIRNFLYFYNMNLSFVAI